MNNAIPFRAVLDVLDRLESEAAGGAPVCVAIVNRTGKLAAFLSLDGTPERSRSHRPEQGIHRHAYGIDHAGLHESPRPGKPLHADFCDPGFSTLPGGVPVFDETGRCIGGVGISGRNRRKTPNSPNVWPKSSWERDRAPIEGTAGKRASHPYFFNSY